MGNGLGKLQKVQTHRISRKLAFGVKLNCEGTIYIPIRSYACPFSAKTVALIGSGYLKKRYDNATYDG